MGSLSNVVVRVAKLCGLACGGCCVIDIADMFYRRPNLLHMEKKEKLVRILTSFAFVEE